MKPSRAIELHAARLKALADRFHLRNLRVFGSAARAEDRDGSDLDLLADSVPEKTSYFDIAAFKLEAQELLGVPVDVRTLAAIDAAFRADVLRDARAL